MNYESEKEEVYFISNEYVKLHNKMTHRACPTSTSRKIYWGLCILFAYSLVSFLHLVKSLFGLDLHWLLEFGIYMLLYIPCTVICDRIEQYYLRSRALDLIVDGMRNSSGGVVSVSGHPAEASSEAS